MALTFPAMLDTTLNQLETAELVHPLPEVEPAYLFKHALVQDTAYTSLLRNERKRLHRLIGETLEQAYPEALDEIAALLVKHYAEAGDDAKTLAYGTSAGDLAARVFANPEAILLYSAALDAALRLDCPRETAIALVTKLGRAYELRDEHDRALEVYNRLVELAHRHQDPAYELAGLVLQATPRVTPTSVFDAQVGQELLDRALHLARELDDEAARAKILWNLLLLNGFTGRYHAAVEYGEQSLAIARALNLKTQIAYTLNDLGNYGYFADGQRGKSRDAMHEARALWRELDILPMLGDNLNNSGLLEYVWGDYPQALDFAEEGLVVSERTGNAWGKGLAHTVHGCVAYEAGDYGTALFELQTAYGFARETGSAIQLIAGTNLALVYASIGEVGAGYDVIQIAAGEIGVALYRAPSKSALAWLTWLHGDAERARALQVEARPQNINELQFSYLPGIVMEGEIGLAEGQAAQVETYMRSLLEYLRAFGLESFIADAELYRGRALVVLGEPQAARAAFELAAAQALKISTRRAILPMYSDWSRLESADNNPARAAELDAHARALTEAITATLPPRYRASYRLFSAVRFGRDGVSPESDN